MAIGYNWLSKLGTKSNTLHKVDLLDSFGESKVTNNELFANEYVMSVLKGKDISLKTFDECRYH